MDTFKDINNIKHFNRSVITIGAFDGIHLGHRALLNTLISSSRKYSTESVVITFDPHPMKIVSDNFTNDTIMPLKEKLDVFEKVGIDNVFVIPFDKKFSNISAKVFIEDMIIPSFKPLEIIIGRNHHFGKNRSGNIDYLYEIEHKYDIKITVVEESLLGNRIISSTLLREKIRQGKMEDVISIMGKRFSLLGKIVRGDGVGRTLNFPTANIKPISLCQIIPKRGVYSVNLVINGIMYKGMCNIGVKPTFNSSQKELIEVHVFNIDDVNLYNEKVKLLFNRYIRDEKKFNSKEVLIEQLKIDKQICLMEK